MADQDEGKRKKKGGPIIWGVLGLLILSLGGFGIGGFGGEIRTVAEVGDEEILTGDYARALQEEQRVMSRQLQQPITLDQLKLFGRDRAVMDRLLAGAAITHETSVIGLSVGDAEVAERIRNSPGFQGLSGGFDREGYAFALRNAGLNEREFERRTRAEAARDILQAAIIGGVEPPKGYAETLVGWLSETRDATVATVTSAQLEGGAVAPTEAELDAFRTENSDRFQTPEQRRITYAWANADALAEETDVDEALIVAAYEARADQYSLPARVLAERLAFLDVAAAETAAAAVAAGEKTFDDLVEERGLTLADVDAGELAEDALDAPVAEALFALTEPGVVGPIETSLGAEIYRVNAILDARVTPLDDVRETLTREAALDEARRMIDGAREDIDDLLAGGATLEEVAEETVMELGTISYDRSVSEGIAGYEAFRAAATQVEDGDFPELLDLADGGLFAIRLDGIDEAVLPELADIRVQVEAAWQSNNLRDRLQLRAAALAERVEAGESFEDLGMTAESITGVGRDGGIEDAPRDMVDAIFEAEVGSVLAEPADDTRAYLIRVDAVNAADFDAPEVEQLLAQVEAQARQEVMADLFESYGVATLDTAGFSVNAQAVQAIEAQLLGGVGGHGGM